MTALPERHEDLLAKACELFKVPSDHTPQLFVACQASIGTSHSEQRGALLMPDAMPFLRDREVITLRWVPTDPARRERDKDMRGVQWDPKLDEQRQLQAPVHMRAQAMVPTWRGPQARAMHVARVLERERAQFTSLPDELVAPRKPAVRMDLYTNKPTMPSEPPFHTMPLSPPPSSPTSIPIPRDEQPCASPPSSPTPNRELEPTPPLEWHNAAGESDDDTAALTLSPAKQPERKSSFGAWCARLNPFARSDEHREHKEHEDEALFPEAPDEARGEPSGAPSTPPKPKHQGAQAPDLHVTGAAAYDIMTQVLMAVREHARNVHCKAPHEFRARRTNLTAPLGVCVAKRTMSEDRPLAHFADALNEYLDSCISTKGALIRTEAEALRAFAHKLMGELQRTSAPVTPAPEPEAEAKAEPEPEPEAEPAPKRVPASKEAPARKAAPVPAPAPRRRGRKRAAEPVAEPVATPAADTLPVAKRTRRSTRRTKA